MVPKSLAEFKGQFETREKDEKNGEQQTGKRKKGNRHNGQKKK